MRSFDFRVSCAPSRAADGITPSQTEIDVFLKQYCTTSIVDGLPLVDTQSIVECRIQAGRSTFNGQTRQVTFTNPDLSDYEHHNGNTWEGRVLRTAYAAVVDNINPGWYGVNSVASGADNTLFPCCRRGCNDDLQFPCTLGAGDGGIGVGVWYFQLSPMNGGTGCATPPEGSYLTGTSNTNRAALLATWCTNVPNGAVCPLDCARNWAQIGVPFCDSGVWSTSYRCVQDETVCSLPDQSNDAGATNQGVYPNGIEDTAPGCGMVSMNGATCQFTCSDSAWWGRSTMTCNSGTWQPTNPGNAGETRCVESDSDTRPVAPTLTTLTRIGCCSYAVDWTPGTDGDFRSPTYQYEFRVLPGGTLYCPDMLGATPPSNGLICLGGNTTFMLHYRLTARARNSKGWSDWSNVLGAGCVDGPVVPAGQEDMYLHNCDAVIADGTCDVWCNSPDYSGNRATQVCDANFPYQLIGPLPTCLQRAQQPISLDLSAVSTSELVVTWANGGFGSVDQMVDPVNYTCNTNEECTAGSLRATLTAITHDECAYYCTVSLTLPPNTCDHFTFKGSTQECLLYSTISGSSVVFASEQSWCCSALPPITVGYIHSNLSASQPFFSWVMEVRLAGSNDAWLEVEGCTGLFIPCERECNLVGLPSDTAYEARVKLFCQSLPALTSIWSGVAVGATNPEVATGPTQLEVDNVGTITADLTWNAGTSNDCVFVEWVVELQGDAGSYIPGPAGCTSLDDRATTSCRMSNLICGTTYLVRVYESCTNPLANSMPSNDPQFVTNVDATCVTPSQAPTIASFGREAAPSHNLVLSWTAPNQLNDCSFFRWHVQIKRVSDGVFRDVYGCQTTDGLNDITTTSCVALAFLAANPANQQIGWEFTSYKAVVSVMCTDIRTHSARSAESAVAIPLPVRSESPVLTMFSPSSTTIDLSWTIPELNDCVYTGYVIYLYEAGSTSGPNPNTQLSVVPPVADLEAYAASVDTQWEADNQPAGCTTLQSQCLTSCTLENLFPYNYYVVSIGVICQDIEAQSVVIGATPNTYLSTLPVEQEAPTAVTIQNINFEGGDLSWIAGVPQSPNCTFTAFEVEFQQSGQTAWLSATGCTGLTNPATSSCTFTGLTCDTTYTARIREVCSIGLATSLWKDSTAFTLLRGPSCIQPAAAPQQVTLTPVVGPTSTQTLELAWQASAPNDCVFDGWEIGVREVGTAPWQKVYAGSCAGLVGPRSNVGCTLTGLYPDTVYEARVRENCTTSGLSHPGLLSAWSTALPVTTSAVPEINMFSTLPEGIISEARPSSLTAIVSTNVELNWQAIDPDTYGHARKCANEGELCQCNGKIYFGPRGPVGTPNTFAEMRDGGGYFETPNVNGERGCRADCFGAPFAGLCHTEADQNTAYACWCEAAQAPTPAQIMVCPITTDPEPNSCGCTGANCTRECWVAPPGSTGVHLLGPQILWYTFTSDQPVATGCQYEVTMDSGYLQTTIQPARTSGAFIWNFTYVPPPPMVTTNLLEATATALRLEVSWDIPVHFRCWATNIPTAQVSDTWVGPEAVEVELWGLRPETRIGISCEGLPILDEWNIGNPTAGPYETAVDMNNSLDSLVVEVWTICSGGAEPTDQRTVSLIPMLTSADQGGSYNAYIDVSGFREQCEYSDTDDVELGYYASLIATRSSSWASEAYSPAKTPPYNFQALLSLNWPAGGLPVAETATINALVTAYSDSTAVNIFAVTVTALYANVVVQTVDVRPAGALFANGSSSVSVGVSMERGISVAGAGVLFGSIAQSVLVGTPQDTTIDGRPQQSVTLIVSSAIGAGSDLPVNVVIGGTQYTSTFRVSWEDDIVEDSSGNPACFVPDASNDAGISQAQAGHPNAITLTTLSGPPPWPPQCATNSDQGAVCHFSCSGIDSFGFGRLVCGDPVPGVRRQGTWEKLAPAQPDWPEAGCYTAADDRIWEPPTITQLENYGGGRMQVFFELNYDGQIRSDPIRFEFQVSPPGGSLVCANYMGYEPPAEGFGCVGGEVFNMGIYIIEVRAVNLRGASGWSNAMQRACPPLVATPPADAWRYDVTPCIGLIDLQECNPLCTGGTVTANPGNKDGPTPGDFTCYPPGQPSGLLPLCFLQADPPQNVEAMGIADDSLEVEWQDGGLNDCGDRVDFNNWKVEVRTGGGDWEEPGGCNVQEKCVTRCVATGLQSNSLYEVRVQAVCQYPEVSSEVSLPGTGSTYPRVSQSPSALAIGQVGLTTLLVNWEDATDGGDCIATQYMMEVRGPTNVWEQDPSGCASLTLEEQERRLNQGSSRRLVTAGNLFCTLAGLVCDTRYDIRISVICSDARANSNMSALITGQTGTDDTCTIPASVATMLVGTATSPSTIDLTWEAGEPNDCTFQSWRVRIRRTFDGLVGSWITNPGCVNLISRTATSCTVTGLIRGTYNFYVVEECRDPRTNSMISQESPDITPPLLNAETPTEVATDTATVGGFTITWTGGESNDCTFTNWLVEVKEETPAAVQQRRLQAGTARRLQAKRRHLADGDGWFTPNGCIIVPNACDTICTATGLISATEYTARVKMQCFEGADAESGYSEPSSPAIETLPAMAPAPTNLRSESPTDSQVLILWDAATPSPDCTFLNWEVGVLIDTFTQFSSPSGCDQLTSRESTSCRATGLSCGTSYTVRVREVCSPSLSTGPFTRGAAFTTVQPAQCLRSATAPEFVRAELPETTSLAVSFMAGVSNDCEFSSFDVQRRKVGEATWVDVGGSCGGFASRAGPSCIAEGLEDGTEYDFRARETCANNIPASPWGVTETPTSTIEVLPVTVTTQIPAGEVSQARPSSILIIYDVNIELTDDAKSGASQVLVCPVTTLTIPNSCGCTITTCAASCVVASTDEAGDVFPYVSLLNPKVLLVDFGSGLKAESHCEYSVEVGANFVTTLQTPTKPSPVFTWSFKYIPPPPTLTLELVANTISSMTFDVSWSVPAFFNCSIVSQPAIQATGSYTGPDDASMVLGKHPPQLNSEGVYEGLYPSAGYDIGCFGRELADQWNTNFVTKGVHYTEDDTDNFFAIFKVELRPQCCENCEPLDPFDALLVPTFDPSRRETTHNIRIDVSSFRAECNLEDLSIAATARYMASIVATSQSIFAQVVLDPANVTLAVEWPANVDKPEGEATAVIYGSVWPYTGRSAAANRVTVNIAAIFANLKVRSVTIGSDPVPNTGGTMQVIMTSEVGSNLNGLKVLVGTYEQAFTITDQQQITDPEDGVILQSTLQIASMAGVGVKLPVSLRLGASEYPSIYTATFVLPTIADVGVLPDLSNPNTVQTASMTTTSNVWVTGTDLAAPQTAWADGQAHAFVYIVGVPTDCTSLECHRTTLIEYERTGVANMCGATVRQALFVETYGLSLSCSLPPANLNPLGIGVFVANGTGSVILADFLDPSNRNLEYATPTTEGVTEGQDQGLSGTGTIVVAGTGFPASNVTQGYLQLYGSCNDQEPTVLEGSDSLPDEYVPLCVPPARATASGIECDRQENWNAGNLGCTTPLVWIRYGENLFAPFTDLYLSVPALQIQSEQRADTFEAGPTEFVFEGSELGADENGDLTVDFQSFGADTTHSVVVGNDGRRMQVGLGQQTSNAPTTAVCKITSRTPNNVTCTLEGSIFGGSLNDSAYQREFTNPDQTFLYPVQATVKFAGVNMSAPLPKLPDGSEPAGAERLGKTYNFEVQLFPCGPGLFRQNRTSKTCSPCPLGDFKNTTGTAMSCLQCDIGRYTDTMGLSECDSCAEGWTTEGVGTPGAADCKCKPGYFKDLLSNLTIGPHGTGFCMPCPQGAICEGFDAQPYSQAGYWSIDNRRFWDCYPKAACEQGSVNYTNICQLGRRPNGRRCAECEKGFYRLRSECHRCRTFDRIVGHGGPLLIVFGLLFIVTPFAVKVLHKSRELPKKKKREDQEVGWLFRIQPAHKWPSALRRLAAPGTSSLRLVVLAFNRLQLIWAIGLLPVAWREEFKDMLTVLGIFAFDYDILRPECIRDPGLDFAEHIEMSYFMKWWTQWLTPFFIFGFVMLALTINGVRHPDPHDRRHVNWQVGYLSLLSVQLIFQFMSHFVDDLNFLHCMGCEDGYWCMVDHPLYKCNIPRKWETHNASEEWAWMAIFSVLDLAFCIFPLFCYVLIGIYKSWCWQHGMGAGVDEDESGQIRQPWFMSISEFWVSHYKGYNDNLRREAIALRDTMRKLMHGVEIDMHEVWEYCVHHTNYERWRQVGQTLQHHVDSVVRFIEIQRKHNVRSLLRMKAQEDHGLSEEEMRQVHGLIVAKTARAERAKLRRLQYTLGLEEHLRATQNFIKEVEGGVSPFEANSLFWSYAWEILLLLQKFLICLVAMVAPPDAEGSTLAGCFFFMLIVLIVEVKLEPQAWKFLNDMEAALNILTLYLVVFAQLEWVTMVLIVAIIITVATCIPMILKLTLPTFPKVVDGEEWKEMLHVDDEEDAAKEASKVKKEMGHELQQVKLAMTSSALGHSGRESLRELQGLMKHNARTKSRKREERELRKQTSSKSIVGFEDDLASMHRSHSERERSKSPSRGGTPAPPPPSHTLDARPWSKSPSRDGSRAPPPPSHTLDARPWNRGATKPTTTTDF